MNSASASGAGLAREFNERDLAELERLIDLRALGLRAARPVLDNAASRKEFADGIESSGVLGNLTAMLDRNGGSVRMMGLVKREEGQRPLVRWNYANAG